MAARAPRFLEVSRAIAVQAEQALEHVDLVLDKGGAIVGRVLKAGGSPSVGYSLHLFQSLNLGDETNRSLRTRTDEQGQYGFYDLPAGTWRLHREPRLDVTLAAGEWREIDLREQAQAIVRGHVLDAGAGGCTAVVVAHRRYHADGKWSVSMLTETEPDGSYELHLWPNDYLLMAYRHSSPFGNTPGVPITVRYSEDRVVDLQFGSGRVAGTVFDAGSGLPIQAAEVALLPLGPDAVGKFLGRRSQGAKRSVSRDIWPRTDPSGSFELTAVTPGRYRLKCSRSGYLTSFVDEQLVTEGQPITGLRIELTRSCSLKGTIALPSGVPVRDLTTVYLIGPGDETRSRFVRSKGGVFEVLGLAPGAYRVVVSEGYFHDGEFSKPPLAEAYVTLQPGENTTVDLIAGS